MGYIRNIWCLILLFISSFALGQSIDDLTTQYHSLSGRYSIKSVSSITDSTYLVNGQFIDYRPITVPFTADSVKTGMYVWSNNCEKWLIDSIGTKSGNNIELKIKGSTSNNAPNLNHGAILDYQYGWPPIPVGIAAHLETCIWDDFMYLLDSDIDNIVAGVSTVDSTTVSNDSIFLWSKGTAYFTGITPGAIPTSIDSTFIRNDSIFIASNGNEYFSGIPPNAIPDAIDSTFTRNDSIIIASGGQEFYGGPATSGGGGLSTQEGATAPYGLIIPGGRGAVYVDTVLNDTYTANGLTNNSWEKVGKYIILDSINQILNTIYPPGSIIKLKGTDGRLPSEYIIQSAWNYDVDTLTVIPVLSGYAVYQPEDGKINLGSLTLGSDTSDDTEAIRKAAAHLQWSDAATLFIPKGNWYINHNLANYGPSISIYGNLIGASRDSSIIVTDSITALQTGEQKIFRMLVKSSTISGLKFEINGDPLYSVGTNQLTVLSLEADNITVEKNWFAKHELGSANTAGNTWIGQFTAQNGFDFTTTTLDTLFPGTSVAVHVANSDYFTQNNQVVIYDATTGNSDTTYVVNRFIENDSIVLGVITDTIPAGAEFKTPSFGRSKTIIRNNVLENMYKGTALRVVSQEVWIDNNIFRNNGLFTTHHDIYNQSGIQKITNNWFEGGTGYGISDGNKQEYRFSGGRVITGNTFWNKNLAIQLVTQSNPVRWYAAGLPVSYYSNRVQNGGEIIANNTFHNTPNTPAATALQMGGAFGGIDPNSVLVGNASLVYANNTHIGRWNFAAGSDYLDLVFEGNIFELNDTSSIENAVVQFPDSTQVLGNSFITRGPDHYTVSGTKVRVDNFKFKQNQVTTINEENVVFYNSWVTNSEFVVTDTMFFTSQTNPSEVVRVSGGVWEGNYFSLEGSSEPRGMINIENTDDMPTFINNKFVNTGLSLGNSVDHDENFYPNPIVRNNSGMRIWSRGQYGYPFGGIAQTEGSGNLIFAEAHTLSGTEPPGGDLIVVDVDSTYSIATYTSTDITGVLMTGARLDSVYAYTTLYEGQILRINTVGAAEMGDYLVIDTVTAGKIKSQGKTRPSGQNLIVQAIEDVTVWNSSDTYEVGDIVEYQDRNYVCTYSNTNQTPQTSQFTGDPYWDGKPLKVQVIKINDLITNPAGGINTVQASLDSIWNNNYIDTSLYFINTDYTLTSSQVKYFDLITFTSRVNSSSTQNNTITLPDPADSLVNTRIVVISDDLDNGVGETYDTEVLAHNLYKGNQSITDSIYVLAGGETIELICLPRATGYIWELTSTWDGWTSSNVLSNTSQTIEVQRKTFYTFTNTSTGRDTLDPSDLVTGDQIQIDSRGTSYAVTNAIYSTDGQFSWDGQTLDSLYMNYGTQHLTLTWNGTNFLVSGDKNMSGYTGYAEYVDTLGRGGTTRVAITGGDTIHLPNLAHVKYLDQIPLDIDSMYTSADSLITGRDGDGLTISIEFDVRAATASTTSFEIWIDIGGSVRPLYGRRTGLTKGSGIIQSWSFSYSGRTGDTWEANGGKVMVTSDANIEITGDIVYLLTRTHKAR